MLKGIVLGLALLTGGAGGSMQTGQEAGRPAAPLTISVTPRIGVEPAVVRVMVRIASNPDNRTLTVELDGGDYYRNSTMQLDGDGEPVTREVAYQSIPSGEYTVTVKVKDRQGRTTKAEYSFQVLGRTESPVGEWTLYSPAPSDAECRLEAFADARVGTAVCRCSLSGVTLVASISRCQGSV
jgi:hypothetical protein